MKKLFLFLTLLSLVFSSAAGAVEYKTYLWEGGKEQRINLNPTDIVEIVGHGLNDSTAKPIYLTFSNGRQFEMLLGVLNHDRTRHKYTGLTEMRFNQAINFLTLKITNASEINKAGPTTVLVLPENATGNYNLVVESSTDSINWTPFHSETVTADTAERLFRVRIVHKGQEEAKAKAEKK